MSGNRQDERNCLISELRCTLNGIEDLRTRKQRDSDENYNVPKKRKHEAHNFCKNFRLHSWF